MSQKSAVFMYLRAYATTREKWCRVAKRAHENDELKPFLFKARTTGGNSLMKEDFEIC